MMTVELDAAQEDNILKTAARRISREVRIPGYRPGKASYNLIVRRFGEEAVQQEAMEDLTDRVYKEAIEEAGLVPYGPASLTDVQWHPLVVKITVPTEPEIDLGSYRDIRLDVPEVDVTEEDVEAALLDLQERYAVYTPVERPAQLGDLVSVALTEKDGDTALLENASREFSLEEPPEDAEEPDLVTPLVGLAPGDEKSFSVTYPDDYDDDRYAGKEIQVSVKVNTIKEKEVEPLDDDFAGLVGDFDTLDELRDKLREDLVLRREREVENRLADEMLDKVIEQAPVIKWPSVTEEEEIEHLLHHLDQQLRQQGYSLDVYLQIQQRSREALREEYREHAQNQLRRRLVLGQLAALEKLELDPAQIYDRAEQQVQMLGGSDEARGLYFSEAGLAAVANDLMVSQVRQRLLAIAKGEAPEPAAEEEEESAAEPAEAKSTEIPEAGEAQAEAALAAEETVVEEE